MTAVDPNRTVLVVPDRIEDKDDADRARGLRAAACLWQLLAAAKAQLGAVDWHALGLQEAEAALEAWERGGHHGFFKATTGRHAPSPTELRQRRAARGVAAMVADKFTVRYTLLRPWAMNTLSGLASILIAGIGQTIPGDRDPREGQCALGATASQAGSARWHAVKDGDGKIQYLPRMIDFDDRVVRDAFSAAPSDGHQGLPKASEA